MVGEYPNLPEGGFQNGSGFERWRMSPATSGQMMKAGKPKQKVRFAKKKSPKSCNTGLLFRPNP